MAVITLQANKFLGALTNLVAYSQIADTLQRGAVGRLISSSQDINVPDGNGKVIRNVDILDVEDLTENSTLLTAKKPTVGEQYMPISGYKRIPLTINRYLMRAAFVEETQLADFIAYISSVMETTLNAYLYGEILKQYINYTPAQVTQTLSVDLIDTSTMTSPTEIEMANVTNAKRICKALLKVLREMEAPSDAYNDAELTEIIDRAALKLIINSEFDVDLIVDTFASLFNSNKITEDERWSETISIPKAQLVKNGMTDANAKALIGWLVDRKKIQFGYFYRLETSFFDGSTLNENRWLHFSYYMGIVQALPGVKVVATYTALPDPAA